MSRRYARRQAHGLIGGGFRHKNASGSDSTIRRELMLVAAANHAVKWKRIPAGINIELPPSKHVGQDDEAPYYTHEELDMLIGWQPANSAGSSNWHITRAPEGVRFRSSPATR